MKYLFFILFAVNLGLAQTTESTVNKFGKNPIFFIDSIRVSKQTFRALDSKTITLASPYYDEEAIRLMGEDGKDGVLYIETIEFAKKRYWNFFTAKSKKYKKLISSPTSDMNVQYILNKKILIDNFEGELALTDDKNFKSLKIISKEDLIKLYNITDKDFGVIIESDIVK